MTAARPKKEEGFFHFDEETNPLFEFNEFNLPRDSLPISGSFPTYSASRIDLRDLEDSLDFGKDRENSRIFHVNDQAKNMGFDSNRVNTTKYNMLSFLPVNLFLQFSKTANFYFLVFALLQVSVTEE